MLLYRSIRGLFTILGWVLLAMSMAIQAGAQTIGELGVGLTPAHFPHQSGDDVAAMYQEAAHLGSVAVLNFSWNDPSLGRVSEQMLQLAEQYNLRPIVQLDILQPGGFALAPPSGLANSQHFDKPFVDAYLSTVRQLAEQQPPYLAVATDINRLLAQGTDRLVEFAQVYKRIYQAAKRISPSTKVFVTFNYDIFRNAAAEHNVPLSALRQLVDPFRPDLDVLALSSVPSDRFNDPRTLPAGYYQGIDELRSGEPVFLQIGWPSAAGGEAGQDAFIDRLPTLLGSLHPSTVIWPILHDIASGPSLVASLGLYTGDDRAKSAVERFRALRPGNAATAAAATAAAAAPASASMTTEAQRREPSDKFAIYANTLAGGNQLLLESDPVREINHARVSPDGTSFVFTRYNRRNRNGEALEVTSYLQTEIVICRMDGGGCQVAVPPRAGIVAANANWTPDGKRLLFVTNDRPSHHPGISSLDIASHVVTTIPDPDALELADPHAQAGLMVAAGKEPRGTRLSRIYLVNSATGAARPISNPVIANLREMDPPLGDHDPKLSPSGRQVALMRHLDTDDWAIVVVDLATGAEHNLSGPHPVDAVPEWSGDGQLLIFWHVERSDLRQSGIYTMRPDGSDRRRVPLPHGYFYSMPAFFPGQGSGLDARIVYSAKADSNL
jgi:hypothetical protein